jgi:hypothetical protein
MYVIKKVYEKSLFQKLILLSSTQFSVYPYKTFFSECINVNRIWKNGTNTKLCATNFSLHNLSSCELIKILYHKFFICLMYGERGEVCLDNLCFGSRHLLLLATQEAVHSYELFWKCVAQRPRAVWMTSRGFAEKSEHETESYIILE